MSGDVERGQALADTVLAAVDRVPRETMVVVARTLMLAPGPLRGLGDAIDGYLHASPRLARLQVSYQLRKLARNGELLDHLGGASEEPWVALRAALEALRDDEFASMLPAS
jgi:hypothetical protein